MKSWVLKVAVFICVSLIRMYQLIISPMKLFLFGAQSSCRFYPTCSSYAKDSFLRFGVVKGAYLTINRVCRCHPWNEGGVDPVPSKECDRCA
jgi:putative membrane protein insertion efficiency factor